MGLDTVDLLITVEKHFGISIPDQEAETITTVGDYYRVVWEHMQRDPVKALVPRREIEATINRIIVDFAGLDPREVSAEKSITTDLGLD